MPQQESHSLASSPIHLPPQSEQIHNALQDYSWDPELSYQNIQTAIPAPNFPQTLSRVQNNDHELVSDMSNMDLSHMAINSWSQEGFGVIVQGLTPSGPSSFRNDYPQQSWNSPLHDQHHSTGFAAGQSLGPQGAQQTTSRWSDSQYDSATRQRTDGH